LALTLAPQIITLAVGSAQKTRQAVATLGKSGVVVSHNLDYSISSPTRPLIRVSIGAATTQEEIRRLVLALKRML
jgi:7-keto-8-aminopelargonate synthetase-like enzyme